MRERTKITLPFDLILDQRVSANSVRVYAVLKSFVVGKPQKGIKPSVIVSHRELEEVSQLSHKTLVKSLTQLENSGWIAKKINSGSANLYIFTQTIFDG